MAGDPTEHGVLPAAAPANQPALSVVAGTKKNNEITDLDNVVTKYMLFTINDKPYKVKREIPYRVGLELMGRFKRNRAQKEQADAARESAERQATAEGKSAADVKTAGNMAAVEVMGDSMESLDEMFGLFAVVFAKATPEPLTAEQLKDMLSLQAANHLLAVLAENVFKSNEDVGDPLASGVESAPA